MIFSDDRKYYYCKRNVKASRSHLLFCLNNQKAALRCGLGGAALENEVVFHAGKVREARFVWASDVRELVNVVGLDLVAGLVLCWAFVLMVRDVM